MPISEEIEKLAYDLWEREGRPAGRDLAHYYEAERILKAQLQPAPDKPVRQTRPKRSRKTAANPRKTKSG